jgi:prevent-host-death family protein
MESIGLFEAKTHLSELVARAERGEEVIITRHQRPVAKLVPIAAPAPDGAARRAAVNALLRSARGRLLGLDWKTLRDEGRK